MHCCVVPKFSTFHLLQQYSFYSFRSVFFKAYFKVNRTKPAWSTRWRPVQFIGLTAWSNAADTTKRPKWFMLVITGSLFTLCRFTLRTSLRIPSQNLLRCPGGAVRVQLLQLRNESDSEQHGPGNADRCPGNGQVGYGRQVLFRSIAYIVSNFVQGWANDTHSAALVL